MHGAQPMTLPERLRDALVQLTPDNPSGIEALRELYGSAVVFRDPIQEVHGIEAFVDMNRRLMKKMKAVTWVIHRTLGDEELVVLEWTMTARPKIGPKVTVDGMTRASAKDGRIVDHRDYWDLGELVTSPLPGGVRILHALLSPFA